MFCPFSSAAVPGWKQCAKGDCALWDTRLKCCVLLSLLKQLRGETWREEK
jgi:hypothetical protein